MKILTFSFVTGALHPQLHLFSLKSRNFVSDEVALRFLLLPSEDPDSMNPTNINLFDMFRIYQISDLRTTSLTLNLGKKKKVVIFSYLHSKKKKQDASFSVSKRRMYPFNPNEKLPTLGDNLALNRPGQSDQKQNSSILLS